MAKTVAERKADERKRKAERLAALGAQELKMVIYSGTRECLDKLKQDHGFEQDEEIITLLIHNLSAGDKTLQSELLKTPQSEK